MFSHFLAGELVFLALAYLFKLDISPELLFLGAFFGFLPDILSHLWGAGKVRNDKWYHRHRDNFSHSLFLPPLIFFLTFPWLGVEVALIISLAAATHPLLDLWGIGWGVKLFLPFSSVTYKLFYKKKLIYRFKSEKEREGEVRKHGKDDWFQAAYLFSRPSRWLKWWGVFEWASLALALALLFYYSFL